MKLLNFTIIKLTICLILGIILAHYAHINLQILLYTIIGLAILLSTYWLFLRKKINQQPFFGILTYLCITGIGMMSYTIQDDKLQTDHYSNLNLSDAYNDISFKIKERLKPDNYNDKYIVSIHSFNHEEASGRLLININRDSLNSPLSVDDLLFTSSKLQDIQKPLNPHQFDYSKYLELKHIHHQLYLTHDELLVVSNSKNYNIWLCRSVKNSNKHKTH